MTFDWRKIPPLSALRAFEATARLGSFSAAAKALSVTHAAVSQQVRALEAHLGVALVWREGRGIAVTAEGVQLAATLGEGFQKIADGVALARSQPADRPLKVTMTASFAAQWLMPRLADFWDRHPDIALQIQPEEGVVNLRAEGYDLGVRFGRGHWPGTEAEFLTSARYLVVGSRELIGDRERLSIAEMQALPWVREQDWPEHEVWMTGIGLDPSRLEFTDFPNEQLALAAARQGFGLHVESAALVEAEIEAGELRVAYDSEDPECGYYVVTPPGPRREVAKAFIKWLKASV